jgi:hypothetical protein
MHQSRDVLLAFHTFVTGLWDNFQNLLALFAHLFYNRVTNVGLTSRSTFTFNLCKNLTFRKIDLEPELSDRYNNGIIPPPEQMAGEQLRLQRPVWKPTPIQVQIARKQLTIILALLALLACACLLVALVWRP